MMTIKRFTCNMLAENCYVVSDEARAAVIIDCGALYEEEAEAIAQRKDWKKATEELLNLQSGDNVVLTGGQINGAPGNTNTIKVEKIK